MSTNTTLTPVGFLSLEIADGDVSDAWCSSIGLKILSDPARPGHVEIPLPGWIWRDVASPDAAHIRWTTGEAEISRQAIYERLSQLTAKPVDAWDAPALVGVLEHFHYGGFSATPLTAKENDWLRQAAQLTGLGQLIPEPFSPTKVLPGQAAISAFGTALRRQNGDADPIGTLEEALGKALALAPDLAAQQALILAATVEFCRADALPQLIAILQSHGLPEPASWAFEPWTRAQAMAFRLCASDQSGACELADEIAANPMDWVATPVLAWALRYPFTAAGRHLSGNVRTTLISAITRFSEARAPLSCSEMIRSTVALLANSLHMLDNDLAEAVIWRSLRAFGTSPTFWDGVAAAVSAGKTMPAELLAGLQAFRLLQQGAYATVPTRHAALVETGLRRLRNLGVADIDRLQVELMSASRSGPLETNHALTEAPNGPATLLRADLAPRTLAVPPSPAILRKALRRATTDTPTDALADLQRRTMGLARALAAPGAPDALALTERPADPAEMIEQLSSLLVQLSGPEARYCGIGIGYALLADLVAEGTHRAKAILSTMLPVISGLVRGLNSSERAQMARAPFPRSASARLHACLDAAPDLSALADALPLRASQGFRTALRRPNGIPTGPALIDTLVVVVSCHANLDTRVAALRQGWLSDLERMNIPYIVLVGGDETRLNGDILQVAASDSYEGLPQKIIAMIDWVLSETGFAHMLKIDDDCHVDPVAWFGDALWRQTDWYGRTLDKSGGLAERDWHQARAKNDAARLSFETLPLEGIYTDGSTGYALSRAAMSSISAEANRIEGRRLVAGAFSEDRMIGAMLTRAGFMPESGNYYSLILRKSCSDGLAVPQWSEGFMPNDRIRHTKVVHFDGVVPNAWIESSSQAAHLLPARIWPSARLPGTAFDNAALCLISPESTVNRAIEAKIAVASVVRNERAILPHFLAHYRNLGVEAFLIADNLSDDGTLEYLAGQPDVALFSASGQFRHTDQGTDWKLALMSQLRCGRWTLVADADEFLVLPHNIGLAEHIAKLPEAVDAQRVLMRDMYPEGNFAVADFNRQAPFDAAPLSDAEPFLRNSIWRGPFSNCETLTSALRHRLMPDARIEAFVAQKTALVRYQPWMRFSTSMHYATEVTLAADDLIFAHFKYHAGFAGKARSEAKRGQYWNSAEEYRTYCETGFASS
ncbi:glycosyltransferase family 2 protein [Paracoccus aestuariivivens]|nr:glycosyltransferase family 2 protein [Paracoccus aestuariivivens]